jgi:hypothetical protein
MSWKDRIRSFFQRQEADEAQLVDYGRYREGIAQVNSIRRKLRPVRDSLLAGSRLDTHSAIAAACEASRRKLGARSF